MFLHIVSPTITLSGASPSTIALSLRMSLEVDLAASGSPVLWNPGVTLLGFDDRGGDYSR